MEAHKQLYMLALYASYFLMGLAVLGVSSWAPTYLSMVETALQVYVALFLLVRFNPWTGVATFDAFDRKIVFSSALFLLVSGAVGAYVTPKAISVVKHYSPALAGLAQPST